MMGHLRLGALMWYVSIASARRWTLEEMPNPITDYDKGQCGIDRKSTICDPDSPPLLSEEERVAVQAAVEIFQEQDIGCGKAEFGVALVGFMEDNSAEYAKTMACGLLDKWGVGKKECNNGVVLFLSIFDRKLHFCTGKGALEVLPDDELEQIIENMKPHLKKEQYGSAIELGISQVTEVIAGHSYVGERQSIEFYGNIFAACVVSIFLGLFGYGMWSDRQKQLRFDNCRRALTQIEQNHARGLAQQFQTFEGSCPICLEEFAESSAQVPSGCSSTRSGDDASDTPLVSADSIEPVTPPGCTLLRCGHGFHQRCLDTWEDISVQCPVCRTAVDGQDSDSPVAQSPSAQRSGLVQRAHRVANNSPSHRQLDRMFRLRRLNHYYPEYIDDGMLQRAGRDQSLALSGDNSFVRRSPEYERSVARARGGHTATGLGSYGGGRSSGGGGCGGGW